MSSGYPGVYIEKGSCMNQQFIDGSWYEEEYREKWYRHQYIETPYLKWAQESDLYGVRFMAMCSGIPIDAKILDLGSGVGHIMKTWRRAGFENVTGVEISKTAWEASNEPNMINGTVRDLSMFEDKEFDLVSSFALLEHIDESIIPEVFSEMCRVGIKQTHFIAHEAGTDPSHINIKTSTEWINLFDKYSGEPSFVIPNPLMNVNPLYLVCPIDMIIEPIKNKINDMRKAKDENKHYQ